MGGAAEAALLLDHRLRVPYPSADPIVFQSEMHPPELTKKVQFEPLYMCVNK